MCNLFCDIEYVMELMTAAKELCGNGRTPRPAKPTPPPTLCASYERPIKAEAVNPLVAIDAIWRQN